MLSNIKRKIPVPLNDIANHKEPVPYDKVPVPYAIRYQYLMAPYDKVPVSYDKGPVPYHRILVSNYIS